MVAIGQIALANAYDGPFVAVVIEIKELHRHSKARQSFLYISAELTRLTLGACARSAAIAGRDGMRGSNT
jgi:hypothetical protein